MEQRLRDALANIEANRQQFEQQLQEANDRNQALSAHLQQTQEALTTIRRALDITPRSEAAPEYGDGSALAPAGGSSSRARPAPNVVKRERMRGRSILRLSHVLLSVLKRSCLTKRKGYRRNLMR
jgi:hypothetical protein